MTPAVGGGYQEECEMEGEPLEGRASPMELSPTADGRKEEESIWSDIYDNNGVKDEGEFVNYDEGYDSDSSDSIVPERP